MELSSGISLERGEVIFTRKRSPLSMVDFSVDEGIFHGGGAGFLRVIKNDQKLNYKKTSSAEVRSNINTKQTEIVTYTREVSPPQDLAL